MPAYDCIFPYYDPQRQRGCCWLRLYQQGERVTAIVSEVVGNPGPTVTEVLPRLGTALIDRFKLSPQRLTLLEHFPPDTLGLRRSEYNQVSMMWLARRFARPQRAPLSPEQVEALTGEIVLPREPFWQAQQSAEWLLCQVGGRRAVVHRVNERWQAFVSRDEQYSSAHPGFKHRGAAQGWVLAELANLAAEFDTWRPVTEGS